MIDAIPRKKRQYIPSCDGSGASHWCETQVPHRHCICGLSMALHARQCSMCLLEGCVPLDTDELEWDGKTYPSWRNHRRIGPSFEAYLLLGKAIGEGLTPRDYGNLRRR